MSSSFTDQPPAAAPGNRPTDRHSIARSLRENARYVVTTARRGWVRCGEVLNTLSVERFRAAVRPGGNEPA